MAPKKKCFNGFYVYMTEQQQELAKKGIKMTMSDMPGYCNQKWAEMSHEAKEMYKAKGKKMKNGDVVKYTSIGEKVDDVNQQAKDIKTQMDHMYSYIEETVRIHPASLAEHKFILIHINPYSCEDDGFYFPAEVSLAEFSLKKGLIRIIHEMVGFDKDLTNAPSFPTADINMHAKHHHLITTYAALPLNYKAVLLKIIGFIMEKEVDETVLNDSTLDLPPIYTAHCSIGNELMVMTSSLFQLYKSVVVEADEDDFNCILKVYHLDKLFMELKNMSYKTKHPNGTEEALPSLAMATDALYKDVYGTVKAIGCSFHEGLQSELVCSNYFVCKWIYILSTHCCQFFDIKLVPGCHYDFELSAIETPVEKMVKNLNISKKCEYSNDSFKVNRTHDLTVSSFPSLDGSSLSVAAKQPMWNRPPNKSIPKTSTHNTTASNKVNNFPPLGGFQKVVPEKTANVQPKMDNRPTYSCLGRGQVLNIPSQLNNSQRKLPKARGFSVNEK